MRFGYVASDLTLDQEFMSLLHSCLIIGVPFALISAFSTPYELQHSLKTTKPSKIFAHPSLFAKAVTAAKQVGLSESDVFPLEESVQGKPGFGQLLQHVRQRGIPRVPVKAVKRDTLAYLVFSSGTSGLPKGMYCNCASDHHWECFCS